MDIDAVITWVDGQDPAFIAQKAKYVENKDILDREDVAGWQRYENNGEIFFCVASLNIFAPWIRKIWIVTAGQDPKLDPFLDKYFPEGHIPYEIVDHSVIFKGYEEFLPTFSSTAIETMTWRIPGLSEAYIDLNDDFMLAAPAVPEDFFPGDGSVVCYGTRQNIWFTRMTRKLKKAGVVTYKGKMINSADMVGKKCWYIRIQHTPRALLKSFFENYYKLHPEAIIRNIRTRFRSADNFNVHELFYLSMMKVGRCKLLSFRGRLLYLKPGARRKRLYLDHKLWKLAGHNYKFACMNSLDPDSAKYVYGRLPEVFLRSGKMQNAQE